MRAVISLCLLASVFARATEVRLERVPEGGVQPQIAQTSDGTVHLLYLKGPPGAGDVMHATRARGQTGWSPPSVVNSTRGTAVAAGTIRGAQIAIGRDDTLHIVWNGPGGKGNPSSLFYTRSLDGGRGFEPQRDLRADTRALDGGASVAADAKGGVFIVWHGAPENAAPGEINRRVFIMRSQDDGRTFSAPRNVSEDDPGVCACCSLRAFVAPSGELITLYRAARSPDHRDMTVLSSKDGGDTFQHRVIGPWAVSACPMSSASVIATGASLRGAWEAEGAIHTGLLDLDSPALEIHKGRHPALAVNPRGETLIAWSVGTGWQKGGRVAWTILDTDGRITTQHGSEAGMPVWGCAAAFADGADFVVLY